MAEPGVRLAAQLRLYLAAATWLGPSVFQVPLTKNGTAVATMLSITSGRSGRATSNVFGVPDSLGLGRRDDVGVQLAGTGGDASAVLQLSGCLLIV